MIKQHHLIPLDYVRGKLVTAGFHVKRIRTLAPASEDGQHEILEVEFIPQTSPSSADWCPADLWSWIMSCFHDEVGYAGVEYRSGKWFARLTILNEAARQAAAGQLMFEVAALDDSSGSGSVGENLLEGLDKSDIPF